MKKLLAVLFVALVPIAVFAAQGPSLGLNNGANSNMHNLSYNATGTNYKATDPGNDPRATQICIFCHTPHNSSPQGSLWNRNDTTRTFGFYSSSTLSIYRDATAKNLSKYGTGQPGAEPNGSSRLCLSCHDGVTALGAVLNGSPIEVNNSIGTVIASPPSTNSQMVYNAQKHHPISFVYDSSVASRLTSVDGSGVYKLPNDANICASGLVQVPEVKLDKANRMQCASCHDPHQTQDNTTPLPFWVLGTTNATCGPTYSTHDSVCRACHGFVTPDI